MGMSFSWGREKVLETDGGDGLQDSVNVLSATDPCA